MPVKTTMFPLLESIDDPSALRKLPKRALTQLAHELRAFILTSVAQSGGHLSSNLGSVELTIALHYVFDTPRDCVVWDVGHQTYAHKILTGRRNAMSRLRMAGGPSGFPRRSESPYDSFGTAHSSTSISAAFGMAIAAQLNGETRRTIAIIGDGAMSAGMAFEALNNAGAAKANLLVVLNDNEMSISEPVGALNNHFARLLSSRAYDNVRRSGKQMLSLLPTAQNLAKRFESHTKGMVLPGTLFEELGFNYIGPIDGHDLETLTDTLSNLKELTGPRFLHVVTRKGKGYAPAEADPILYHGVTQFDPLVGITPKTPGKASYTQIFGDWVCDMAAADPHLVCITPAMREGSGLVRYAKEFPNRYFDVGIAEQHAVTFAAGLACAGMKPVVAIYSTFLQRGYDQLIHDVALQNLPILFAIDRAGVVGADGATHIGAFDLSYLRCLPNMTIMAPADENECRQMLYTGFSMDGPAAVRYPRGAGPGTPVAAQMTAVPIGRGEVRRQSSRHAHRVAILAFGSVLPAAMAAAEAIDATLVNMRFVKPLDVDLILRIAAEHSAIVTVEENVVAGGAGSAVAEALSGARLTMPMLHLGLPDRFPDHGDPAEILRECGLDSGGIADSIQRRFQLPQLHTVPKPAA